MKRLGWALAVAAAVLAGLDTWVVAASGPLISEQSVGLHGWPQLDVATAGTAAIGALIVSRYPRHPIGWLLGVAGAVTAVSLLLESVGYWASRKGGADVQTVGQLAAWAAAPLGGAFALTCLGLMFLVAPDGVLLARWWRFVALVGPTGYLLNLAGRFAVPPSRALDADNPDLGPVATALNGSGITLVAAALIASAVCLFMRFRSSHGDTRQQLRWIVTGAVVVGLALVHLLTRQAITGKESWVGNVPLSLSYAFLLVTIALAVLRYRLYDLDVFLSRAVVVAVAGVVVATAYVVLVVIGGTIGAGRDRFWPSLLGTAVIALAFQPLRSRLIRFADRLAFGPRAEPYLALAELGRQAGRSVSPDELLTTVAEAAGQSCLAVQTRVHAGHTVSNSATWTRAAPRDSDVVTTVPITDDLGVLGEIAVHMPADRTLRAHETRLLRDLADQAAVALRNAALEDEVARQVQLLEVATTDLADSRQRLFDAADDARRRMEGGIAGTVLPTLARVRVALAGPAPSPGELAAEVGHALDRMREITRGVYPIALTRRGLVAALTAFIAEHRPHAVLHVDQDALHRRLPPPVEAAAYFCCVEAATYSTEAMSIRLTLAGDWVEITVSPAVLPAHLVVSLTDRIEASGGTLRAETAQLWVSLPSDVPPAQSSTSRVGPNAAFVT